MYSKFELEFISYHMTLFYALLVGSFFILCSCDNTIQIDQTADLKSQKAVNLVNKNPQDVQFENWIVGTWQNNGQSALMSFYEDGSFRRFAIADEIPDEEEELDHGKWLIENGKLKLTISSNDMEIHDLYWSGDSLVYFGDIESEYDSTFGTKEEFILQMGFIKINDL